MKNLVRLAIVLIAPSLAACGAAPDEATDEKSSEDVGVAAATVERADAKCAIAPRPGLVGETCTTSQADGVVKQVLASVKLRLVARENAIFQWKVISVDGSGTPSGEGCDNSSVCLFDVTPKCGNGAKTFAITLKIKDRTRLSAGFIEEATLAAIIPDNPFCQAGCTAPPATSPSISVVNGQCGSQHTIFTSAVPGATTTQIQTRPKFGWAWSDVSDLFGFPGITNEITSGTSCLDDGGGDHFVRARACNNCGCSPWAGSAFVRAGNGC